MYIMDTINSDVFPAMWITFSFIFYEMMESTNDKEIHKQT